MVNKREQPLDNEHHTNCLSKSTRYGCAPVQEIFSVIGLCSFNLTLVAASDLTRFIESIKDGLIFPVSIRMSPATAIARTCYLLPSPFALERGKLITHEGEVFASDG